MASLPDSFPPEQVVTFTDPDSGAAGMIVLHSTRLGPAAGGCRLWRYPSDTAMAVDALRLAEGMSLKNALAEVPFGGGKAVIREPDGNFDRAALFRTLGRRVAELQGRYITAEDVGTTVEDMVVVAGETAHVAGLPQQTGRAGGDPSPWTARGVFRAMQVAARHRLSAELGDLTVAVQGLGHVGFALCGLLHEAGARLLVAEPRSAVAARAAVAFDAEVMSSQALLAARADVFAPCALGGVLDAATVEGLRAKVICGAANNQLAGEAQSERLRDRGILYVPDFLVNAGGIVSGVSEYLGWTPDEVIRRVDRIGPRLEEILLRAEAQDVTPHHAAMLTALRRIGDKRPAMPAAA